MTSIKAIVVGLLIALGLHGDVRVTDMTVVIHLHDTFFVLDFTFLLSFFAL
jgi:hypothetical protein